MVKFVKGRWNGTWILNRFLTILVCFSQQPASLITALNVMSNVSVEIYGQFQDGGRGPHHLVPFPALSVRPVSRTRGLTERDDYRRRIKGWADGFIDLSSASTSTAVKVCGRGP